ncbi:MAG TPA: type II secretion system F family protein, partial [Thermoanaerobaculia bacterium]
MPSFEWRGRTRAGQVRQGVLVAENRGAAEAALRRDQIQVQNLREKREIRLMPRLPQKVGSKRLAIFTRQFSVMLDAGLPLVQCLEILGEQEENRTFRAIIQRVRSDVEQGSSLAEAMRRHPKAFDELFVNMVAAGEAGGILDIILQRLATYLEKITKLKSQVKSALIYPASVITIAIAVVWIILRFVIPTFAQLFAGLGSEMPWITRVVVGTSNFVGRYSPWIILAVILLAIFLNRWHKTD